MVKKVGSAIYAHKSNLKEFLNCIKDDDEQKRVKSIINKAKNEHLFEILKYDKGNLSLIECETWNTMNEPIVGDSHLYKLDGTTKIIKGGKTVYHSKEYFVANDYQGFDIEKAKQRTKEWHNIPNIKNLKNKIGFVEYWHNLLRKNGMEV